MKKLGFISSALIYLSAVAKALAADIVVSPPEKGGFKTLSNAITNILTVSFAVAILIVLSMLIWGAFEWITSGGDKDAVGKARGRIINALIGLAVLAVAFAVAKIASEFLGLNIGNIGVPTPGPLDSSKL